MSSDNAAIDEDLLATEIRFDQETEKYSIQKFPGKGIDTYIERIKELYEKCSAKKEEELVAYVLAMGKLLNSLANMENEYLYRYEQRILFDSISLFLKFFIEEVDIALNEKEVEKKVAIHEDISNSIQCIMEVYRNLIGSMTNADSQVSINFAVDTNLYELSPKLTAFYADILSEILKIYKVEDYRYKESQYGFIIYPSIKNMIQSRKLFQCRPRAGAVAIIYIFESLLESIDTVSIALIHEAFHFLGRKERFRKKRAEYLNALIASYVAERVIEGIENKELKSKIDDYIRALMIEQKNNLDVFPEDDNSFYGREIIAILQVYYEKVMWDCLQFIEGNSLKDELYAKLKRITTSDTFKEKCKELDNEINQARINAKNILKNNHISNALVSFMEVFHEVYADIVAILVCEITPELYELTFEDSSFISRNLRNRDIDKNIRTMYVADIISKQKEILSEEVLNSWKEYRESLVNNETNEQFVLSQQGDSYPEIKREPKVQTKIKHTKNVNRVFDAYFEKCTRAVVNKLKTIEELETFRKTFKLIVTGDKEKVLLCIFSGARYKDFVERYKSIQIVSEESRTEG